MKTNTQTTSGANAGLPLEDLALLVYCIADDLLKALQVPQNPRCRISNAEVLTLAVLAHLYHHGNYRAVLTTFTHLPQTLFPYVPQESGFNKRLHRLRPYLMALLALLTQLTHEMFPVQTYCLDTTRVPVCHNIRIGRSRLLRDPRGRGYVPSKRVSFYGLKLVVVCGANGAVYEVGLMSGGTHDVQALDLLSFWYVQAEDAVLADRGFEDYEREDGLRALGVRLCPLRRRGSRRRGSADEERVRARGRRVVETVIGVVKDCIGLGGRVRAVSLAGVELKVLCGVLAYQFRWLFRQLQSA